jgi:hypothetical protein
VYPTVAQTITACFSSALAVGLKIIYSQVNVSDEEEKPDLWQSTQPGSRSFRCRNAASGRVSNLFRKLFNHLVVSRR